MKKYNILLHFFSTWCPLVTQN